ncbi:glycoside hydrolase family 25 protein [Altererythrobacter aquiaggeris]|uniref:glycoside hydrolase family 25 protein n=1 Tax=Aestuarierythrobacter aquiaggeris TaxID=1898396 RepID=UPI0030178A04
MARRKSISSRLRWAAALLLLVMLAAGFGWWHLVHWTPDRARYPLQGVLIGAVDGQPDFRALKAIGAQFVYLEASRGADFQDAGFARNYAAARDAGMQVGMVHTYDPCLVADGQSANFVTIVPRVKDLLPPAIALGGDTAACVPKVSDAALESELMTFVNQVENHVGKPALLKISPSFEERFDFAGRFERNLWLTGNRLEPAYAGRPWALWTANESFRNEAGEAPVRWVVAR